MPCPPGFYCSVPAIKEECVNVLRIGYYCPEGTTSLELCDAGFYCPNVTNRFQCDGGVDACPSGAMSDALPGYNTPTDATTEGMVVKH